MTRMASRMYYKGLLLELKNFILTSSLDNIQLPLNTFQSILFCSATVEYQCGRLTEEQYFARLAVDFGHSQEEIEASITAVRNTYQVKATALEFLASIKSRFGIKGLGIDWSLFERVFVSSEMNMQKPELRFYRHVLDHIHLKPKQVILVDDDTENILAAFSRLLLNLFDVDPVARGTKFLKDNAQNFSSVTHTGITVKENFAQLLILELTGDRSLVDLETHLTTWNFFIGPPVITPTSFPDDLDTTSLGITILQRPAHIANLVMDMMLRYRTPDRLVQTFFSEFMNRVDPVVCCNVLSLFYQYGRGHQLSETLSWVGQVLQRHAYIHGTTYYPEPETFLFFVSRLLLRLKGSSPVVYKRMRALLTERVKERVGIPTDAASLAMRLIVCHQTGIHDVRGLKQLLSMQEIDGGWEMGTLYQYASKNLRLGNRGTSTALALEAIRHCQPWLNQYN
ncbi:HAD-like protein [Aspergillus pseudonomiae]|uniref:HAD-like protein n=1 Tax=Aspergillus pseudonomiae TaxID=1506151 RepID=A0A5N6I4F4_9EURO|nr:HAD-like protein [Aspergillus pseudonomiae]KAB8261581.1 HAD-like protein [Aspergillus pseudonomiae]KAE8406816.1 HAD-like protein [Aspergillus pseudonomiae]